MERLEDQIGKVPGQVKVLKEVALTHDLPVTDKQELIVVPINPDLNMGCVGCLRRPGSKKVL